MANMAAASQSRNTQTGKMLRRVHNLTFIFENRIAFISRYSNRSEILLISTSNFYLAVNNQMKSKLFVCYPRPCKTL